MNRFVIADPQKCIGCYTCEAACVQVHEKVGLVGFPRLQVTHTKSGTMPVQCRHCDDAPCASVCPVHAITIKHREVQLNESVCIGCKMCALACPFGAITPHGVMPDGAAHAAPYSEAAGAPPDNGETVHPLLSWTIGQRSIAVKCDLCHFLPEGPACIRVCPTKALYMVDQEAITTSDTAKRVASVAAVAEHKILDHHRP